MDESTQPPSDEVLALESRIGRKIEEAVSKHENKSSNVVPTGGETDLQSLMGSGDNYYEKITGDLGERGMHELTVSFPDHTGHIVDTGGLICGKPEDEILCPLVEHCYILVADETLASGEKVRFVSHDVTFNDAIILRTTITKLKELGRINSCTIAYNGNKGQNSLTYPDMAKKVQEETGIDITARDFTAEQSIKNIPFDLLIKNDSFTALDLTGYSRNE